MTGVKLRFRVAGSCRQFEHVVLRSGRLATMRFPAMFAVIEHPREGVLLFDAGYSRRFFDATRPFPARLHAWVTPVTFRDADAAVAQVRTLGYAPDDVRRVFVSHYHADHVAGLADFPRAHVVCTSAARESLRHPERLGAVMSRVLRAVLPHDLDARLSLVESAPPFRLPPDLAPFEWGHDLCGDGSVVAIALGGHAEGQSGLLVHADDGRRYFLVADACWRRESFERRVMPHRIAQLLFSDRRAYAQTLEQLATLHERARDLVIVPSHCERTLAALTGGG